MLSEDEILSIIQKHTESPLQYTYKKVLQKIALERNLPISINGRRLLKRELIELINYDVEKNKLHPKEKN